MMGCLSSRANFGLAVRGRANLALGIFGLLGRDAGDEKLFACELLVLLAEGFHFVVERLGEGEGSAVHLRGVVLHVLKAIRLENRFRHGEGAELTLLASQEDAAIAARVGGNAELAVLSERVGLEIGSHHVGDHVSADPMGLAFAADDTVGLEDLMAPAVEFGGEELLGGTDGVGGVDDDDIKSFLCVDGVVMHESETIANEKVHTGVVVGAGDGGEILLAGLDDVAIDVNHGHVFNGVMLAHFTQDATVATADDENALGVLVGMHRNVAKHFLVAALVTSGNLNDAVQKHDTTPGLRVEDDEILKLGLLL